MKTYDDTKIILPRRTVLAMAASALGAGLAPRAALAADLVDLQVIDRDTDQAARVWRHAGRLFIAGRPGARYSLRVTNNSGGRVLAVMSVDGVNILTGETAGFNQRGYVFGPYETYDVSGWRKSDTEVAAFTFAALPRSYAALTGRPGDVGVIGLAAFTERVYRPLAPTPEVSARERYAPPPAALAAPPPARVAPAPQAGAQSRADSYAPERRSEKLGTAHGSREWSSVRTVAFERATSYPQLIRRVEYDAYDNLVRAGVIPRPSRPPPSPRPFPNEGYVPDPPYRR